MSRIPVPSHLPTKSLDRSSSPVPPQPAQQPTTMSASNLSTLSDTRKKQYKRDEVCVFALQFLAVGPGKNLSWTDGGWLHIQSTF